MNQTEEIKKLSTALAQLASTITLIIEDRMKSVPGQATFHHQKEPSQSDRFLDKKQVADLFRVTPRTIDCWMAKRYLPYFKLGRVVRFRLSDIQAHLDTNFRINRLR